MNVKLVTWTSKPIETIYWAFMNMHNPIPDNLDDIHITESEKESFMDMLLEQPHQTVLEYVNTVWYIDGASRAFQQQLTRTRQASYSIQSLRIVKVDKFATNEKYTISNDIACNKELLRIYENTMADIEENYNLLLEKGAKTEDARGILPLNIHSPITMSINLRALYHMLELRFCLNTQEEYRILANKMKMEVENKLGEIFSKPMKPLCFSKGYCPSPVYCGKYAYEQKLKMDVSKWIKG